MNKTEWLKYNHEIINGSDEHSTKRFMYNRYQEVRNRFLNLSNSSGFKNYKYLRYLLSEVAGDESVLLRVFKYLLDMKPFTDDPVVMNDENYNLSHYVYDYVKGVLGDDKAVSEYLLRDPYGANEHGGFDKFKRDNQNK